MNDTANPRRQPQVVLWSVLLAVFLALGLFLILSLLTGGFLSSLVTIAVVILLLGLFNYLFWGRAQAQTLSRQRTNGASSQETPPAMYTLPLNEPERVELLHLVEKALAEPSVQASLNQGRTGQPDQTLLAGLRDRLRGFGA